MKERKYREGPKALKAFEQVATALFKAPKTGGRDTAKKSNKKSSERKSKPSDKG